MKKSLLTAMAILAVWATMLPCNVLAQEEPASRDMVNDYMAERRRNEYYPAWQKDLDVIRAQADEQVRRNDLLKQMNDTLTSDAEALKKRIGDVQAQIDQLRIDIEQKRLNTDERHVFGPLRKELKNKQLKIKQAKLKLSDYESDLLNIEKKMSLARIRLQEAELKKRSRELAASLENQLGEDATPGSASELEALRAKLEEGKLAEENLERRIDEEKARLKGSAKTMDDLRAEIKQLRGQKRMFLERKASEEKVTAAPASENPDAYIGQQERYAALVVQRNDLQGRVAVLDAQVKTLDKNVPLDPASLEAEQKALVQDMMMLDQQNQEFRNHITQLRENVAILEKMVGTIDRVLKKKNEQSNQKRKK